MHLTYDPDFNIAYIRLRNKRGKVTTVAVSEELNVDLDREGRIYGIEFLNANQQLGATRHKKLVVENRRSGKKSQVPLAG
jgi:uncharacterized protein YuzE